MEIRIRIDDYEFSNVNEIRESLLFEVFWEYHSSFYPTEHWVDFGCILLGWWVSTIIKLLRGDDEGSFAFMDGPYSLSAKFDRSSRKLTLEPRGMNAIWEMDLVELIEALAQAVNIVYEKFVEREVSEKDKSIFRKYSEILHESLLELQRTQVE